MERYTRTAIALHWLIFLLIACGFALAVYMVDLPVSPQKLKYFAWHKWIGVSVFALALVRIGWRLTHAAPAQDSRVPVWQQLWMKCVTLVLPAGSSGPLLVTMPMRVPAIAA